MMTDPRDESGKEVIATSALTYRRRVLTASAVAVGFVVGALYAVALIVRRQRRRNQRLRAGASRCREVLGQLPPDSSLVPRLTRQLHAAEFVQSTRVVSPKERRGARNWAAAQVALVYLTYVGSVSLRVSLWDRLVASVSLGLLSVLLVRNVMTLFHRNVLPPSLIAEFRASDAEVGPHPTGT